MIFSKFVTETKGIWDKHLSILCRMHAAGYLDSNGYSFLYPSILLITNCSGFYVVELIGAVNNFTGLTVKLHKEKSIYRYLSQFDDSPPIPLASLDGANAGFKFLCLAQEADFEAVQQRFPTIELYQTKLIRIGGKGSVFFFKDDFEACAIENCILVNRMDHLYRCKNILAAYVFTSSITKPKLVDYFRRILNGSDVNGVHVVRGQSEQVLAVAGQLQSMYLMQGLHETTIGEFLKLHPEIIKKAFKTDHFLYEPYLTWLEHDGTCEDEAINPDLLIKRHDGYFDIYDLKTAALERKNITKDDRKRRRFIDYVYEGIAQLANYEEYFTYSKNAQYAKEKYGVVVNQPKLVLVVGNWENSSIDDVKQALRGHSNIEIIDYDTLCHQFIGANEQRATIARR